MTDTADRVKKIVAEHLGVEETKVTDNANFIDDLGADSLDTVELVMAFEEEFGCEIPDEAAEKILTVKDAIGNLPPLIAGSTDPDDLMHSATALSEKNLKRIRQSVPGGTWRDWDKELQLKCHKKSSGKTYPSVYGRMLWDAPSPTITTQFYGYGNGRFGHPSQDRALSLREGAILQSFPRDYKFISSTDILNKHKLGLQIGNAVPVRLGEVIGLSILEHIRRYNDGKEKSNA